MASLLVVDDIEGVHEMMDIIFQDAGLSVQHALTAQKAVEIQRQCPAEVIISDIQMPGTDGLTLLSQLKEVDPDCIVIMMTAQGNKEAVIRALRLGAFDFVEKPYDEEELVAMVKRGVRERRKRSQVFATAHAPSDNGNLADKNAEIARLRSELEHVADPKAVELEAEVQRLRAELANRDAFIQQQKVKEQELLKRQSDVEVREGALKTMDQMLRERMQNLRSQERSSSASGGLSPEQSDELLRLRTELKEKETLLEETEASIREREMFLEQSEESFFEKSHRLTELQAELEQMKEDLLKREQRAGGGGGGGDPAGGALSEEEQALIESLKLELTEKEKTLKQHEQELQRREMSVRKAEMLVKAREQFLQQSEDILFGEEQPKG